MQNSMPLYKNVLTRFLKNEERACVSHETELPLVIEATQSHDVEFLWNFLSTNSKQILKDITTYGAVLLRGFDVKSGAEFEKTLLSINGLKGISELFMPVVGRVYIDGLKYVLHPNIFYKTGGGFEIGDFHHENYYTSDVASYVSFCCLKPSRIGGETGLVKMSKVYKGCSSSLKEKLESSTCFVKQWEITDIAKRYKISHDSVIKIVSEFGLPICNKKVVHMYKPSVLEHPMTKEKFFQLHFNAINGMRSSIRTLFKSDYNGPQWTLHRIVWSFPRISYFLGLSIKLLSNYKLLLYYLHIKKTATSYKKNPPLFDKTTVNSMFDTEDKDQLCALMRAHYTSFLWRAGDVLLIDNLQVAHAGMPGKGPRILRTMLCNPIKMNYTYSASGVQSVEQSLTETLGEQLVKESGEKNKPKYISDGIC